MENDNTKKGRFGARSKMAFAATMITVPMFTASENLWAKKPEASAPSSQKDTASKSQSVRAYLKFSAAMLRMHETFSIVGVEHGQTLYKNNAGKYFVIDTTNGSQKFLSDTTKRPTEVRMSDVKLLGVDPKGHVVQSNSSGEKFYLSSSGEVVTVK
jgi:hypothetical protein